MRVDILTLFPRMFRGPFDESIIKRAQTSGLLDLHITDIRDFAHDRHRIVDDYPYGGGAGMVLKPEPVFEAIAALHAADREQEPHVILMTPQGEPFTQQLAMELAGRSWLALVCGHYEGVDERIRAHMVNREISIGDYVLTGGELPAMVVLDAVVRLLPGVMGSPDSAGDESFASGLLEYPHYTRPASFNGWDTPAVLLSGHHAEVDRWRRRQAILRTAQRRPDLLAAAALTPEERAWLEQQLPNA